MFFWVMLERLSSHTSSDDHKLYRSADEIALLEQKDPVKVWKDRLIEQGVITAEDFAKLDNEIKERIRKEYSEAEKAEDPTPKDLGLNVRGPLPELDDEILPPGKYRIGDTVESKRCAPSERKFRPRHFWRRRGRSQRRSTVTKPPVPTTIMRASSSRACLRISS